MGVCVSVCVCVCVCGSVCVEGIRGTCADPQSNALLLQKAEKNTSRMELWLMPNVDWAKIRMDIVSFSLSIFVVLLSVSLSFFSSPYLFFVSSSPSLLLSQKHRHTHILYTHPQTIKFTDKRISTQAIHTKHSALYYS